MLKGEEVLVIELLQRAGIDEVEGSWITIGHDLKILDLGEQIYSSINLSTIKKDEIAQQLLQQAKRVPMMLRLMGKYVWTLLNQKYQFEF